MDVHCRDKCLTKKANPVKIPNGKLGPKSNSTLVAATNGVNTKLTDARWNRTVTSGNSNSLTQERRIDPLPRLMKNPDKLIRPFATLPSKHSRTPSKALNARNSSSNLPVLCVYSDKNELISKEQFRSPETKIPCLNKSTVKPSRKHRENSTVNVNVKLNNNARNNRKVASNSACFKPTMASMARANDNHCVIQLNPRIKSNSNSASRPMSNNITASTKNTTGGEKVLKRRNENVPLQRKAEMATLSTSPSAAASAASAATLSTPRKKSNEVVRISVGVQPSVKTDKIYTSRNVAPVKKIGTHPPALSKLPLRVSIDSAQNIAAKLQPSEKVKRPSLVDVHNHPVFTTDHPSNSCDVTDFKDKTPPDLSVTNPDAIEKIVHDQDNYVLFDFHRPSVDGIYSQVLDSPILVQENMVSNPDPGYSSEKSPDDEDEGKFTVRPFPSTCSSSCHDNSIKEDDILDDFFKFVSNDNIMKVTIQKTAQGLGLSVTGGVPDRLSSSVSAPEINTGTPSWPGLIRVKKIFPHGAAWQTGQLHVGDVLLAANGVALTGSTNCEALEVLRCSPRETELLICRIPQDTAEKMGIYLPESNTLTSLSSHNWLVPMLPLTALGEFEICMTKVNGSLGFTLRKEDESVLGHYIRSIVKEPAISDGRIKVGDKIIRVNNVDMSTMSHAEAVAFLRRCPDTVTIRLFRDSAITPLSPLSPTEPEVSLNRPRPLLRQEAQDLLYDLAVRKQSGSRGGSPAPLSGSPCSPRRRRLTKTPSPDLASVVKDRFGCNTSSKENLSVPPATNSPPMSPVPENDLEREAIQLGLDVSDSNSASFHTPTGVGKISRPDFLDLSNSMVKKQRFMFTPPMEHPASSFTNSPIESRQCGDGCSAVSDSADLELSEYQSPCPATDFPIDEPDQARKSPLGSTKDDIDETNLDKIYPDDCISPLEDSMNETDHFVSFDSSSTLERQVPRRLSDHNVSSKLPVLVHNGSASGKEGLFKWKGVVLTPDEEYSEEAHLGLIQTIELNKGWNSRLGFSVGLSPEGQLIISAIYDDSVAAKDGRLQVGDHVLRVNGEKLQGCTKEYVIDILRKTRGPVAITIRKAY